MGGLESEGDALNSQNYVLPSGEESVLICGKDTKQHI